MSEREHWTEFNLPYSELEAAAGPLPGVLIDTEVGTFLIGHINPWRRDGLSNELPVIPIQQIVRRYRRIWHAPPA